jgi:hypothetical protein
MRVRISQLLFSFITGASLSNISEPLPMNLNTHHEIMLDSPPTAIVRKLSPSQVKDVLDLKLKGVDAYVVTVTNPSQRSYSLSTASLDAPVIRYEESQKILAKKGSVAVGIVTSVAGHFFMPVGIAGNIYSLAMMKKGKIFEGKLRAMLLNKDVINSYSQLSRLVLVKSDQKMDKVKLELIDLQTMNVKTITTS